MKGAFAAELPALLQECIEDIPATINAKREALGLDVLPFIGPPPDEHADEATQQEYQARNVNQTHQHTGDRHRHVHLHINQDALNRFLELRTQQPPTTDKKKKDTKDKKKAEAVDEAQDPQWLTETVEATLESISEALEQADNISRIRAFEQSLSHHRHDLTDRLKVSKQILTEAHTRLNHCVISALSLSAVD